MSKRTRSISVSKPAKTRQVGVRLPSYIVDELDREAIATTRTRTDYILHIIKERRRPEMAA